MGIKLGGQLPDKRGFLLDVGGQGPLAGDNVVGVNVVLLLHHLHLLTLQGRVNLGLLGRSV